MKGDDLNKTVGAGRPSFAERIGKAEPTGSSDATAVAVGSGQYKPYGYMPTGSINETCDVQRWLEGTEIAEGIEFQYRFLMQIGYVSEEQIKLFLPDCIVVIEGKKLRDLRKRLARRQVHFIQQYSSRVWNATPPKGEPIVESVNVLRPEKTNGQRF